MAEFGKVAFDARSPDTPQWRDSEATMKRRLVCLNCAFIAAAAGRGEALGSGPEWIAQGQNGVIASDSAHASQAGLEMLKAGGNAVDAAVAVSFALGVTRPYSTGLGGGGFLLLRLADGRVVVQDSRETAPAAATSDMFVNAAATNAANPRPNRLGHLAVAVPGLLAGRSQILSEYGTFPLASTLEPAIRLARSGFPVDQHYVDATREVLQAYERYPCLKDACPYVWATHLRGGDLRTPGDALVQPQLARLLEALAQHGPDFFYRGPVAEAITEEIGRHHGVLAIQDLAQYRVKRREPLRGSYRGYELLAMPPPSSGGITLIETLNILDILEWSKNAADSPGLAAHLQVEAMKHAFADRARWLGDADFVSVPTDELMAPHHARRLAARIKPDAVAPIDDYGAADLPEDAGTSHFCVVDRFGNVVVSTETINTSFGSLAAVGEWGLILNNEMDDFAAAPGQPNAFGLVQSNRNAVAAGKRPLSSMAPTIVLKDGRPYLLLGASGGPRIISSVLNVVLGVLDRGDSLEQAMLARRPHHQWRPDVVYFDAAPPDELRETLTVRGHKLASENKTGIVQALLRTEEGWVGASDPRKGGRPAAY